MAETINTESENELFEAVKRYIGVTWSDEGTDAEVRECIASGKAYLNDKYGSPADFYSAGLARDLLFDFVRYKRDYALEVFEENFRSLIIALQNNGKVKRYAEEGTD